MHISTYQTSSNCQLIVAITNLRWQMETHCIKSLILWIALLLYCYYRLSQLHPLRRLQCYFTLHAVADSIDCYCALYHHYITTMGCCKCYCCLLWLYCCVHCIATVNVIQIWLGHCIGWAGQEHILFESSVKSGYDLHKSQQDGSIWQQVYHTHPMHS